MLQLLRTALTWLAPLAFALGLAHLGYQAVKHWDVVTLDLRFFWLAGEFWREGLSPYSTDFATAAAEQFNITKGAIWYYTPNWFFISVLLSELSPLTASRVVLIINALLLLGASALNVAAYSSIQKSSALVDRKATFTKMLASLPLWAVFGLHAGFMALSQPAGNSLHLGQSSILIYFGASLLVFALPTKRKLTASAGFALLLLKPQIGLLVAPALLLSAFGRRVLMLGGVATFLLSAPALVISSTPDILLALSHGAAQYNDQNYNLAGAMTGFRHIAWALGAVDMASLFYLFTSLLVICSVFLAGRLGHFRLPATDRLMLAFAVTLAFASLHIYDFTLVGVLLLYAASLRPPFGAISIAAFLLIWRAGNLPQVASLEQMAVTYYPGSLYASLAALVIFISMIAPLLHRKRELPRAKLAVS